MTPREALFAACRAATDDDLLRLVVADFLDESGSEADAARASLIRYQCELHSLPRLLALTGDEYRRRVKTRVAATAKAVQFAYHADLLGSELDWNRGFIIGVECEWAWWVAKAAALAAEHAVAEVRLTDWPPFEVLGSSGAFSSTRVRIRVGDCVVFADTSNATLRQYPGDVLPSIVAGLLRQLWPTVQKWKLPQQTFVPVDPNPTLRVNVGELAERIARQRATLAMDVMIYGRSEAEVLPDG